MEPLHTFAKRLRQARIRAKLSMEELSQAMDKIVSKQTLSKYELGKTMPGSSVLIELSRTLNVDIDYFFREYEFDMSELEISFRKQSSVREKDIKSLEVQIHDDIERFMKVDNILSTTKSCGVKPIQGVVLSSREDMIQQAGNLRQAWGLGISMIPNVQELLEDHGIKVLYVEGPEGFDGVSGTVNENYPIIVINSAILHSERRRFTAMHELGHILFNKCYPSDMKNAEKEKLCHAFASEMLLPSSVLVSEFGAYPTFSTKEVFVLQRRYGVSADAIVHKMSDIGIMSDKRYRGYCIAKRKSVSFKESMEKSRYQEMPAERFEANVYKALSLGLITTSKAASMLNCSVGTIRSNFAAF